MSDLMIELRSGAGVPISAILAEPEVTWNHIDGPLMHWAGQMHWLTFRERISLFFGRTTVSEIARRRFPIDHCRAQIAKVRP
jgi:hypothetical protein